VRAVRAERSIGRLFGSDMFHAGCKSKAVSMLQDVLFFAGPSTGVMQGIGKLFATPSSLANNHAPHSSFGSTRTPDNNYTGCSSWQLNRPHIFSTRCTWYSYQQAKLNKRPGQAT
jgi:hypothetical protein